MLNKIILIGRLTRDPELRYTPNGTAVANFSLAVERSFTNKNGEREVDFIDITVWRKQAESCANHLGKGRLVAVEGRLQIDKWEDDNEQKRKAPKIIAQNVKFLDWPKDSKNNDQQENQGNQGNQGNQENQKEQSQNNDIEVPF